MASLPPWWWLGWARGNTFPAMSWRGRPWDGLSATTCMAGGTTAPLTRNGPLRRKLSTMFTSAAKYTSDPGPRRKVSVKSWRLPGMAWKPALWNLCAGTGATRRPGRRTEARRGEDPRRQDRPEQVADRLQIFFDENPLEAMCTNLGVVKVERSEEHTSELQSL